MRWLAIGLLTIVLAGTAVAATGPAAGSAAFLADRQSASGGFAEQGRVPAERPGADYDDAGDAGGGTSVS